MELSYDELRRIYRLEKNTSKLVEVDEDFYDSLSDFIQGEKKEYLAGLKSFSSSKARDFANLKKIVDEIFSIREKKLLSKALVSSRNGEGEAGKIASQEKKTFKEILAISNYQRQFLKVAHKILKQNGILVYSTCTFTPEENELNIKFACDLGFEIEEQILYLGKRGLKIIENFEKLQRFYPNEGAYPAYFIAKLRKT